MKVGSFVYATDSGLGILAKDFYDHKIITDVMVIRHGHHPTHDEWYKGHKQITNLRNSAQQADMRLFCAAMDVMLFIETPFYWEAINYCREVGVKTVLVPMHECTLTVLPAAPDLFLCPSLLDLQVFEEYGRCTFLPVPVDTTKFQWKERTSAEVFVHNAGHGGLKGRNGTIEVAAAFNNHVKSGARLIIRAQDPKIVAGLTGTRNKTLNVSAIVQSGTLPYTKLYNSGDVFLFPEKFNGLSLPLQEAYASGMLVMCTDRFPMNTWLPTNPMIPKRECRKNRIGPPYREFDEAVVTPEDIASTVDAWFGKDIRAYSKMGKEWASNNNWETLGSRYMEVLEILVNNGYIAKINHRH